MNTLNKNIKSKSLILAHTSRLPFIMRKKSRKQNFEASGYVAFIEWM